MFSISKSEEPAPPVPPKASEPPAPFVAAQAPAPSSDPGFAAGSARPKATPSVLSADLTITGNIETSGDVKVEGIVEGDIRAAFLTVGETATIRGEVVAEEVVVQGRVVGRLRGVKVRLAASARVEGDIIHKAIAIEGGAHVEGTVQRQEDPVGQGRGQQPRLAAPKPAARDAGADTPKVPMPAE
jgi:cytoskeletal protein CcmA (bactofilin family)